ncbi:MAG: disulfide bond formation protein B [Gammaproteobacteria bacterium]|nr:disulfide bond formation protein B [Gammaproteobacteria bacterium]
MPTHDHSPNTGWTLVFLAWLLTTTSTLGAFFLGEIMGYTPCLLCWYQRICMFPLVFVLAAGLFPFDAKVIRYALPLAITGWLLAAYHLALVNGLIPESAQPCRRGVPCSDLTVSWFGFINIPLLSLLAFSFIIAMLIATHFKGSK